MKKIRRALAIACGALAANACVYALSTNDIALWTGSGTNRAALVIEWNSPQVFNNTTVSAPIANKTLVWGYQFNGEATGTQMLDAILASDRRLYVVINNTYGTFVEGIGYNRSGDGLFGVADASHSYPARVFSKGRLLNPNLSIDAAYPINSGDLYWSGYFGPNWNVWNDLGGDGGFAASPNRGANPYWDTDTGIHGQWEFAELGLDDLAVHDGSWIGFSVAAAGYDTNAADPATAAFNLHEQAPPSPEGNYAVYVVNTNDFAGQIVSSSNVVSTAPYDNPAALLGPPALRFLDVFDGGGTNRSSIIDPPYNVSPGGNDLITEISDGGQITVMMGRKVYHDPNNPYGVDLILFGNSFFSAAGTSGAVSDLTDLDSATVGGGTNGHSTTVSVSPDGTNWYSFANTKSLFPANAFRWDGANHSWTDEQSNPTKPLAPSLFVADLGGVTGAAVLDQYNGSAGGTGYNLQESGFTWIQYVRVQPGPGTYTVIDAIAAVNPIVEGDTLAITPDEVSGGMTNLAFQIRDDPNRNFISVHFESLSAGQVVTAVALTDFSSFAPVPGSVARGCQITVRPTTGTSPATFVVGVALSAGDDYTGNGSDLRVLQWNGGSWKEQPFVFDAVSREAVVSGLTNLSAIIVSRLAPQLTPQAGVAGMIIPLLPFTNTTYTLQRSADLVTWIPVTSVTPTTHDSLLLQDPAPPADQAFYRLIVSP